VIPGSSLCVRKILHRIKQRRLREPQRENSAFGLFKLLPLSPEDKKDFLQKNIQTQRELFQN